MDKESAAGTPGRRAVTKPKIFVHLPSSKKAHKNKVKCRKTNNLSKRIVKSVHGVVSMRNGQQEYEKLDKNGYTPWPLIDAVMSSEYDDDFEKEENGETPSPSTVGER
jgi:hypothetical protein